jgi:hypothetical protein
MMIERIAELTARWGGGAGTTRGSFARIFGWVVAFLVVMSLIFSSNAPKPVATATPRVHFVTLGNNDPRSFASGRFGKHQFRIAWISGSEGALLKRAKGARTLESIANYALPSLPSINGREVVVDAYLITAARVTDLYFAVLDAIHSKADMIVVSLNPAFALFPFATHQWKQFDSKAAVRLLSQPNAWPVAASVLSPSDLMWGLAASELGPVGNRAAISTRIHDVVDDLGPLDRSDLATATATNRPDRTQALLAMDTAGFWNEYKLHEKRIVTPLDWAHLLRRSLAGQSALNKAVLRAMARSLRRSKIPSYVYVPPVRSDWFRTSVPLHSAVAAIEKQLGTLDGDFAAENILYQPLTATRFVPPIPFRHDLVHLLGPGAMGPYLGTQLCRLVTQVHDHSPCQAAAPVGGRAPA